jgi:formate/nitrite transporter FocA (FNT family)
MGLTSIGVASARAFLGPRGWHSLVSYLMYPVGFISVIIGRVQRFTENTLHPVILCSLSGSITEVPAAVASSIHSQHYGALLFALLAKSSALQPDVLRTNRCSWEAKFLPERWGNFSGVE